LQSLHTTLFLKSQLFVLVSCHMPLASWYLASYVIHRRTSPLTCILVAHSILDHYWSIPYISVHLCIVLWWYIIVYYAEYHRGPTYFWWSTYNLRPRFFLPSAPWFLSWYLEAYMPRLAPSAEPSNIVLNSKSKITSIF